MNMMAFVLGAFFVSVPNAWAWGAWAVAVQAREPTRAALWDGVIGALGSVAVFQLWSASGDHPLVLLSSTVGHMLGTFLVVRFHKS